MSTLTDTHVYGQSYVQSLPLYIPGKSAVSVAREHGFEESSILKMASNENPLGMSEHAKHALAELAANPSSSYPDSEATALKQALSERFHVDSAGIIVGNGSSEILELAARAFAGNGCSVVMSQYAFASYSLATMAVNATPVVVPAQSFGHDLEAMLEACTSTTTLLYLANPNNPTGTFLDQKTIRHFLRRVPEHIVIVLDEAYAEYLCEEDQSCPRALLNEHHNLIIARTFSKAYGLAALRIGYSLASKVLTDLMNRVRPAFNTNSFAQAAATAALADEDFVTLSREINAAEREHLYSAFDAMKLQYVPSSGNFVLVRVGQGAQVAQRLLERAIVVRPMASYELPEWLRITVGLPEQNKRLLTALQEVL
ncbi:MAG: histidinol-phosphate transaminase [Acidobacteriaceae bacterium]|nr:histidinol-phosphate transaminase [Acidobacteriaceae bacterium]